MKTSGKKCNSIILLCSFLMTACVFAGDIAFASPVGPHVIKRMPVARHNRVVAGTPNGYRRGQTKRAKHQYTRGVHYRKRHKGVKVIAAPVGTIISALPLGFSTVIVYGSPYHLYGGVYYREIPAGYMVVEKPRTIVVSDNPPRQVTPVTVLPEQVKVTAVTLNVRTGPGLNYSATYQVQRDDILQVIKWEAGWYYVRLPSRGTGWVMDSFTIPTKLPANG